MVKGIESTYKDFTRRTARYPKSREKEYLMLGLMNEAGEVGGAFKKEIRDHVDNTDLIIDEMGDVLWYLTRLCDVYDIKLSELMTNNIDKLLGRMTPEEAQEYMDYNVYGAYMGEETPVFIGDYIREPYYETDYSNT